MPQIPIPLEWQVAIACTVMFLVGTAVAAAYCRWRKPEQTERTRYGLVDGYFGEASVTEVAEASPVIPGSHPKAPILIVRMYERLAEAYEDGDPVMQYRQMGRLASHGIVPPADAEGCRAAIAKLKGEVE